MKTFAGMSLVLLACAATSAVAGDAVVRLSEPVQVTDAYEVFGAPLDGEPDARPLAEVLADQSDWDGRQVAVRARVAQVCQKKGCFLVAQDGEHLARVTFRDYGFFVPTDSTGKVVTLVGTLGRRVLDEAQAKHYAEDAGDDPAAVTGPRSEVTIVADSVLVPIS